LALRAAELVWGNLPAAFANGQDRPAREAMSYAALMAGMALANARLGAVHGIAHPLGYRYKIGHGVACAALLPHVMRFNRSAAPEKYQALCGVFGGDAAEAMAGLLRRLGLPQRLAPLGLRSQDFDAIAEESLPSGSLKANPRKVTAEDVREILSALL
jgi:alcohol dehydrogenase class IV